MIEEFIENFLYQNSPKPKGYYGQFPMSEGIKSELGFSKKFPYEGFSFNYQGPDKTGAADYAKKGFKSIFGNVPGTGIGGGTAGQRIIYENLKNNPFGFTKFVGRFIPGLSTALGAANVIDRFNQGEYLRMLMAGGSMLPVLGIPFAAAEMATDAGEALINKEKEKEVIRQRAQNAAKAQESRNQSRDDYTGGGGTVVIGKGGGQTKTVSPRSREAMYSAPTRRSSPPPFRRFNNGGIVGLFRRF